MANAERLPPVKHEPLLMRRQPGEDAEVYVGIMARDIDMGVTEDGMLPVPEVRTAAKHIDHRRHQLVDPEVTSGRLRLSPLRLLPSRGTPPGRRRSPRGRCSSA